MVADGLGRVQPAVTDDPTEQPGQPDDMEDADTANGENPDGRGPVDDDRRDPRASGPPS
jgi:hypothetical protein